LTHNPATGQYQLLDTPDRSYEGYLSRGDVALATLQILEEAQWLKRIITVQSNIKKKDNEHES
ncbi:MAG: NAD(P)-dependent oxidoreductase, partial [Saezia sp.]